MVPPDTSFLTWIRHTLMITNDHIFRHAGLDGLAIVMLIELCLHLFIFFMILNVSILMFGFQKASMNTICYGSNLLWGHWTMATLMVFAIMWLVHHQWIAFSAYRRRYLIQLRDAATPKRLDKTVSTISALAIHGRTVVVQGLPTWLNKADDPDAELYQLFERLFPGQVDSAVVARNPSKKLKTLMQERDAIRTRYEIALAAKRTCLEVGKEEASYVPPLSLTEMKNKATALKNKAAALKDKIPVPGTGGGGSGSRESQESTSESPLDTPTPTPSPAVLTMTTGIQQELCEKEQELSEIDTKILSFDVYEESTGYVVFLTAVGRSLAVQTVLTTPWEETVEDGVTKFRTAPKLNVKPAPEPRDIVHDNIGANHFKQYTCGSISPRVVVMRALSFLLLLFWAIPVAVITALTQLDTLEMYMPFIKPVTSIGIIRSFLSGFLPTVALVQFMANLPKIFAYMAKLEGAQSWTDIDASATARYVWFQIINVLFVSALTGDILARISSIISQPNSLINLLGTAIPGTYLFFTSYIMLMAFAVYPLELVRVGDLLLKKIKMKRTKTKRQWEAASAAPLITGGYAKQYGYIMLAFAITLEFATVAPLLLPFGVLFFGLCYLILRHNIYYVYGTQYEGMGKIWPWLMWTIILITIICQITLIGIFYGRKSPMQALFTWPLIFLVLIFYIIEQRKHTGIYTCSSNEMLYHDS